MTPIAATLFGLLVSGCLDKSSPTQPGYKEAVLDNGSVNTPLALSEAAFDELNRAAGRKDVKAFGAVFLRGDAVEVANGTRVQVIDGWLASRKVRILDGPHKGKTGWVAYEQVKD